MTLSPVFYLPFLSEFDLLPRIQSLGFEENVSLHAQSVCLRSRLSPNSNLLHSDRYEGHLQMTPVVEHLSHVMMGCQSLLCS